MRKKGQELALSRAPGDGPALSPGQVAAQRSAPRFYSVAKLHCGVRQARRASFSAWNSQALPRAAPHGAACWQDCQ